MQLFTPPTRTFNLHSHFYPLPLPLQLAPSTFTLTFTLHLYRSLPTRTFNFHSHRRVRGVAVDALGGTGCSAVVRDLFKSPEQCSRGNSTARMAKSPPTAMTPVTLVARAVLFPRLHCSGQSKCSRTTAEQPVPPSASTATPRRAGVGGLAVDTPHQPLPPPRINRHRPTPGVCVLRTFKFLSPIHNIDGRRPDPALQKDRPNFPPR